MLNIFHVLSEADMGFLLRSLKKKIIERKGPVSQELWEWSGLLSISELE